jgi:hypothetical protein
MPKDINITVDTFNSAIGFIDIPFHPEIHKNIEGYNQDIEDVREGAKDSMVQRCVSEFTKIITEVVNNMSSSRASFLQNRDNGNEFSLDVQIRTYDRSQVGIKKPSGDMLQPKCKDYRLPYEKTSSKINPLAESEYWEAKHAK